MRQSKVVTRSQPLVILGPIPPTSAARNLKEAAWLRNLCCARSSLQQGWSGVEDAESSTEGLAVSTASSKTNNAFGLRVGRVLARTERKWLRLTSLGFHRTGEPAGPNSAALLDTVISLTVGLAADQASFTAVRKQPVDTTMSHPQGQNQLTEFGTVHGHISQDLRLA